MVDQQIPDLYGTLGVSKGANKKEIKAAYIKLAKENDPSAGRVDLSETQILEKEEKMKQVNEAYSALSDSGKRTKYDQLRELEERRAASGEAFDTGLFKGLFESLFGEESAFFTGGIPADMLFGEGVWWGPGTEKEEDDFFLLSDTDLGLKLALKKAY